MILLLKAFGAWATGSVALLASLAMTMVETGGAFIASRAARIGASPADHDHRFGHGKIEALFGFLELALSTAAVIAIWYTATEHWQQALLPRQPLVALAVSFASICGAIALDAARRRSTPVVNPSLRPLRYPALAVAVVSNGAVIAAVAVASADALIGAMLGCIILWRTVTAAQRVIDQLMDKEWPEVERTRLAGIIAAHRDVRGAHDLRTRSSGGRYFAQVHIVLDPGMSMRQATSVVAKLRSAAAADYPFAEIFFHVDPVGAIDRPDDALAETDVLADLVPGRPPTDAT